MLLGSSSSDSEVPLVRLSKKSIVHSSSPSPHSMPHTSSSTIPLSGMFLQAWKVLRAVTVVSPKNQNSISSSETQNPCLSSASCSSRTCRPPSPSLSIGSASASSSFADAFAPAPELEFLDAFCLGSATCLVLPTLALPSTFGSAGISVTSAASVAMTSPASPASHTKSISSLSRMAHSLCVTLPFSVSPWLAWKDITAF
mmetsp:Transcript_13146/g.29867  ORF Transcript_13146/g.29867 Transcript_13146/m.29867 type:complete len:200 (-) Transcript_13146:349-948(-)